MCKAGVQVLERIDKGKGGKKKHFFMGSLWFPRLNIAELNYLWHKGGGGCKVAG